MPEQHDALKKKITHRLADTHKHVGKMALEAFTRGLYNDGEDVAEEEFEAALDRVASDEESPFLLGTIEAKKGVTAQAQVHLQKALSTSTGHLKYNILISLARLQYSQKAYNLADTYITRCFELDPNKPDAYYVKSMALYKAGKAQEALPLAQQAANKGYLPAQKLVETIRKETPSC